MCKDNKVNFKCTNDYSKFLKDINLKTIPNLADTFKTVVGLSDHTLGISVPIASVALGACIIEKHLTLDRKWADQMPLFL